MRYILILLTLLLGACGTHISSDPIKVEPITVNHYVKINIDLLKTFYKDACIQQFGTTPYTEEELAACIQNNVDVFLNALAASSI